MASNRTSRAGGQPVSAATNLIAGAGAGMMNALICFPLGTIKVRMQLSRQFRAFSVPGRGIAATAMDIAENGGGIGFYRGLGAATAGIIPKIAIRFASYDWYKQLLTNGNGQGSSTTSINFLAGLAAGVTEAVAVVTPMELVKIRLQAQNHASAPLDQPRYRNAAHAVYTILKDEGLGTNVAANFAVYTKLKTIAERNRREPSIPLPSCHVAFIDLLAGAVGPLVNAPIDTIKTRLQKSDKTEPGQTAVGRIVSISSNLLRRGGPGAVWAGIVPRVARVAPGQGMTFYQGEVAISQYFAVTISMLV